MTRAHHADVGGSEPGSLPPGSHARRGGRRHPADHLDDATLESLVSRMRNPDERRGDLRAQLAGEPPRRGRVAELCARRGRDRVAAAMDELLAYSERVVRAAIRELPDGRFEGADAPRDADGAPRDPRRRDDRGDSIDIDFDGTAPQYDGNLNCPLAVTRSACFYVVRCLTAPDLPASGGAFVPVTVRAPEGCPRQRPLAGRGRGGEHGDVEPDHRRRLRRVLAGDPVPAQGQGTMNNVVFGNDRFTYYETIGGGQGACPHADGPSGVHVAMSNTFNTPAEALELSYPLRVERYELRLGSGGDGRHRGGDGVVRELRILERCRLSLLTQRRAVAPRGARGGEDGLPGRTLPERRGAPGVREPRPRAGRPPPDRDPRRRRLGRAA